MCLSSIDSPEMPATFKNILLPPSPVAVDACGLTIPLPGGFSSAGGDGGDGSGVGTGGAGAGEGDVCGLTGGCTGMAGVSSGVAGWVGWAEEGAGNPVQDKSNIAVLMTMASSRNVIFFFVLMCLTKSLNFFF